MKKILLLAAITFCVALLPRPALAHELIRDSNMTSGMIFHIDPDDDPAPGKPSTLFFDLPSVPHNQKISATLSVSTDAKTSHEIPLTISDNSVSAKYTFPAAGTYHFALVIVTPDKPSIYQFSQVIASGSVAPRMNNFAFVILVTTVGLLVLSIAVILLRRKRISAQSQR